MGALKDLTGRKFGRWTVVARDGSCPTRTSDTGGRLGGQAMWRCVCECGGAGRIEGGSLRRGLSKSCGCLKRESPPRLLHGESYSRGETVEHRTWSAMRRRCNNPNDPNFKNYGGRGIAVCERWEVFANFLSDMGRRPSPLHSLDRIDVDGNYEPNNCRWANKREQAQNRRTSRQITVEGETLCASAWSRRFGVKPHTIIRRVDRGWSPRDAIGAPAAATPPTTMRLWADAPAAEATGPLW